MNEVGGVCATRKTFLQPLVGQVVVPLNLIDGSLDGDLVDKDVNQLRIFRYFILSYIDNCYLSIL